MKYLIGHFPLLQRLFRSRGWYRWMYAPFTQKPMGPYPTREAASVGGDPIPPQVVSYHLTMPEGCLDIREQQQHPSWGQGPEP
jgi:hypothetical protein